MLLSFDLHTERHHNVGAGETLFERRRHTQRRRRKRDEGRRKRGQRCSFFPLPSSLFLQLGQEQGWWSNQGDRRPKLRETPDGRPGYSRVEYIPDNGHLQSGDARLSLADRQQIEQPLGGMLVHPVAGVDDRASHRPAGHLGRPCHGVTDDDGIGTERFQRLHGINERLALLNAAPLHVAPDDIRSGALRRKLEGDLRPGARLIEQGDDGPSSQRAGRSFPIGIGLGRVEQLLDLGDAKFSQAEQVPAHHEPPKAKGRGKRDESRGKKEERRGKKQKRQRRCLPCPFLPSSFFLLPLYMAFPASPGRFKGRMLRQNVTQSQGKGKREKGRGDRTRSAPSSLFHFPSSLASLKRKHAKPV